VQIQKGANEDQTLKSLEFVSQSLYMLERTPEGNQAALGETGNRACQHLCETLMHAFARSLKTQHLKGLQKCSDQFHMVQDIALIFGCRNAQQARPFEACCCLRSIPPEAAFKQFARASRNMHFQMTDGMKQQKILM